MRVGCVTFNNPPNQTPHGISGFASMHSDVDDLSIEVGASGEYFVYLQLCEMLPEFTEACWVSTLKQHYIVEPSNMDNQMGCDFLYTDFSGVLSGANTSLLCHIEVKSSVRVGLQPFHMSMNEWRCAERCHQNADETYIIILVESVTTTPKITQILVDPIQLLSTDRLDVGWSEIVVSYVEGAMDMKHGDQSRASALQSAQNTRTDRPQEKRAPNQTHKPGGPKHSPWISQSTKDRRKSKKLENPGLSFNRWQHSRDARQPHIPK